MSTSLPFVSFRHSSSLHRKEETNLNTGECEDIDRIFATLSNFVQIRRPGMWLVDTFPALADYRAFDLVSNWRKVGEEFHKKDLAVWMGYWRELLEQIKTEKAPYSFENGFAQSDRAGKGMDEPMAAYVCGSMVEASSETTSVQLNNTIVGILSRGRTVIDAAHEEMDRPREVF